jgi:hypothetical protein
MATPGPMLFRKQAIEAIRPFDPEGSGYDYRTAIESGMVPREGHWSSRDPRSGLLLKGRQHPTWDKLEAGEREAGYAIRKRGDGRYYSEPQGENNMALESVLSKLSQKHDPRLVQMIASQFTEDKVTPPDMWRQGFGMRSEIDEGARRAREGLSRKQTMDGSIYRTDDGRLTNVNKGGELVQRGLRRPAEVYDSGSYQTFTHGNVLSRQAEEEDAERGAPNFDLINPYKLPEDSDLRRRIEYVQSQEGKALPNYGLRRKLAQEYEAETGQDLTARRLGVEKAEKALEPTRPDFRTTRGYAEMQERGKTERKVADIKADILKHFSTKSPEPISPLDLHDKASSFASQAATVKDEMGQETFDNAAYQDAYQTYIDQFQSMMGGKVREQGEGLRKRGGDEDLRAQAEQLLKRNGKVVNEQTIKTVMERLRGS